MLISIILIIFLYSYVVTTGSFVNVDIILAKQSKARKQNEVTSCAMLIYASMLNLQWNCYLVRDYNLNRKKNKWNETKSDRTMIGFRRKKNGLITG